jgi:hypothetical protein
VAAKISGRTPQGKTGGSGGNGSGGGGGAAKIGGAQGLYHADTGKALTPHLAASCWSGPLWTIKFGINASMVSATSIDPVDERSAVGMGLASSVDISAWESRLDVAPQAPLGCA